MSDKQDLLKKINALNFTIFELHLFLDTHPYDTTAMALLKRYQKQQEALVAEYESKYGPIRTYNVTENNRWQWISNPWPWEYNEEA